MSIWKSPGWWCWINPVGFSSWNSANTRDSRPSWRLGTWAKLAGSLKGDDNTFVGKMHFYGNVSTSVPWNTTSWLNNAPEGTVQWENEASPMFSLVIFLKQHLNKDLLAWTNCPFHSECDLFPYNEQKIKLFENSEPASREMNHSLDCFSLPWGKDHSHYRIPKCKRE